MPKEGRKVKVRVRRQGKLKHPSEEVQKRQVRGKLRKETALDLQNTHVTNYYYKRFALMQEDACKAGNVTDPQTQDVLRKIKSEQARDTSIHTNPLQEVKLLQEIYNDITHGGFIQYLSINPFQCHMFTKSQLEIYAASARNHQGVLYVDATSSILQKIPGQNKVFLYSVVMKNPLPHKLALPIAEFLSTDQHTSEITHFLSRLCNSLKQTTTHMTPRRVEIDFSWPLLHSVLAAFNSHDIKTYLDWCYDIVHEEVSFSLIKTKMFPHICSAHMIKTFIRSISAFNLQKPVRKLFLRSVGHLMNLTTMDSLRSHFLTMCNVFGAPTEGINMKRSLAHLEDCFEGSEDVDNEEYLTPTDPDASTEAIPIKKSLFYDVFKTDWEKFKGSLKVSVKKIKSKYYQPELIEVLVNNYLGLVPLWSGLMMGDLKRHAKDETTSNSMTTKEETRDTNTCVENYFGNVKKRVEAGKRLRPANFVRQQFSMVSGQIAEIKTKLPHEFYDRHSSSRKDRVNDETDVEQWFKRKKKTSAYFSRKKTKKQQDDVSLTTIQPPHWGGSTTYKECQITLTDTCPIDNLLYVAMKLMEGRDFTMEIRGPLSHILQQMYELVKRQDWTTAKIMWLEQMCGYQIVGKNRNISWNIFGSEHERVAKHLAKFQETIQTSTCSIATCRRCEKTIHSTDITIV